MLEIWRSIPPGYAYVSEFITGRNFRNKDTAKSDSFYGFCTLLKRGVRKSLYFYERNASFKKGWERMFNVIETWFSFTFKELSLNEMKRVDVVNQMILLRYKFLLLLCTEAASELPGVPAVSLCFVYCMHSTLKLVLFLFLFVDENKTKFKRLCIKCCFFFFFHHFCVFFLIRIHCQTFQERLFHIFHTTLVLQNDIAPRRQL